jgi:hypothetical protein
VQAAKLAALYSARSIVNKTELAGVVARHVLGYLSDPHGAVYDVAKEGQRFLLNLTVGAIRSPLTVIVNWQGPRLDTCCSGAQDRRD